jgi:hypothetical protein
MDVEITYLKHLLCDLTMGIRNLRELKPAPYDLEARVLSQAAKIHSVETRIFELRQMRLL